MGLAMLLCFGYAVYWIVRSRRRWRTILYALLSTACTLLVGISLAWIFPLYAEAIGTLAGFLLFIAMAITAAEHARFTLRQSQTRKSEQLSQ
jgi:zinc transporter ZupT